jgi:hypothetical protein
VFFGKRTPDAFFNKLLNLQDHPGAAASAAAFSLGCREAGMVDAIDPVTAVLPYLGKVG